VRKEKHPQARDRIIGARLRAIRKERTTLSLEEAAALAQWSPSTMSRIETGKRHIAPEDVATISTIYGLPLTQRRELVESARAGNASGWWDGVDVGVIATYEAEAFRLTDWSVNLVPGLLRTCRYAVGLMRSSDVPVEARWSALQRRQRILGRLDYVVYLGEAALRTPFGGAESLREQLAALLAARGRGIRVRVVRERQPSCLVTHSWSLMEFPNTTPVVHVEATGGGLFLHDEVAESYLDLVTALDRLALSPAASEALIGEILGEPR